MTATTPSGRPLEPMDTCAPVSLARQFLAERDHPNNMADQRACEVVRQLLRYMDAAIERGHGPLPFDRQLVASMLRRPEAYTSGAVQCQAALVAGTLGADTPMDASQLERRRPRIVDEE